MKRYYASDLIEVDEPNTKPNPGDSYVVLADEAETKAIEALGWMQAECCGALDRGEDPRQMDIADMLARARRDLGLEDT
jgi:hypothetical protein